MKIQGAIRNIGMAGLWLVWHKAGIAQHTADRTQPPQRDLIDVVHRAMKKETARTQGSALPQAGRMHWSVVPGAGYTLGNGVTASLTGNNSFYTSSLAEQNISSITAVVTITAKKQFSFVLQPNIWLPGNRLLLAGDYRYLINPQLNFGLGGHSRLQQHDLIDYRLLRVYQYLYHRIKGNLFAGAGFHYNRFNRITAIEYTGKHTAECRRYGLPSQTTSLGFSANLLFDKRRNLNNPVAGGSYLLAQYIHYPTAMGSTTNWRHVVVDSRKYIGLNPSGQKKLALWGYGSFSLGRPPFLELPSTASDANNNMGRGYIAGRFRGRNLLYSEAEYRTPLARNGLIGGVLFANVQSVTDWPSNTFTRWHPAVGTGLRIKFNKYADTNICIDYGFGFDGSHGVFVNLGEVF